ncbi:hypothetical protein [Streptomyces sp. NPDC048603]|uniref:hypothetical protein n=1 Tax=Streptomyces sp. NPDC048603 TaxID=3365577 RepID=UPI00371B0C65
MSGPRYALTKALTVACVVLLALFAPGAGAASAAVAGAAEPRSASSAPAPAPAEPDPSADPEPRAAVRTAARGTPVGQPSVPGGRAGTDPAVRYFPCGRDTRGEPGGARWTAVRSVVLRC